MDIVERRVYIFGGLMSVCLYYMLAFVMILRCNEVIQDIVGYLTITITALGMCLLYKYKRVALAHIAFWSFGCLVLCAISLWYLR